MYSNCRLVFDKIFHETTAVDDIHGLIMNTQGLLRHKINSKRLMPNEVGEPRERKLDVKLAGLEISNAD